MKYSDIKFYIGPMSKNIVDTIIKISNENNIKIGLIPSRRQIDYYGGYVGWTTKEFINYIKTKTDNIIIQRDHGGINQSDKYDDGFESFKIDSENNINIIHIDPWKYYKNYQDGLNYTIETINFIYNKNDKIYYEIGTEENIRKFEIEELEKYIIDLKNKLNKKQFENILYLVIQSGTSLYGTKNNGIFNNDKLINMINLSKKYNLLSKEHNGDYLKIDDIRNRFKMGLTSINIAPEFGVFETDIILENINQNQFDKFFNICYESKNWVKWVNNDFNPFENKKELIRICGHYQFNKKEFKKLNIQLDNIIQKKLYNKLKKLINYE